MTKKEKEELERKQKKKNKTKNIVIIVLVVLIIALAAFFMFKEGIIPFGKEDSSSDNTNSVSDTIDDSDNSNNFENDNSNQNNDINNTDKSTSDEPSSDKDKTENDEKPNKNDGNVYSASLPLTDNDTMEILYSRYGKGYDINRSTQNGEYTNYAVNKDDERYATVSVNLSTGEAIEIIMETGKQTKFNLL